MKKILTKYSLPILSGIFIGTTYIPFYPWAMAFGLVPLWMFWRKNASSPRSILIGGWLTQFILTLIGFHWVANTAIEFGGFPKPVGYVILVLFAAIAHLYIPIAGWIWAHVQKTSRPVIAWLLIPLIYAVCESFYPTIFFWHLGYTWLWINLPAVHTAEWIGFYGINLITLFLNLLVLLFVWSRQWRFIVFAAILFMIPNAVGLYLKNRFVEGDQSFKALLIQANIGNAIKVAQDRGPSYHTYILRKFVELSDGAVQANKDAQLMIWPETAFPDRVRSGKKRSPYQDQLRYSVDQLGIPLMTGAYEIDEEQKVYNSLVLFNRKGEYVQSYRKTMLLAFGEYFPGSTIIPQLKTWFPMVSDFGRGTGPAILTPQEGSPVFGAQICYESLFDNNSRILYSKGAQIIINVTNDSWFGKTFEPYQHLYMTLARALEFRVPVIRATNTGISTAISAAGEIAPFSPVHQEWTGAVSVKYRSTPQPTLFSHYAGQWPWILLFLSVALFVGGRLVKSRNP